MDAVQKLIENLTPTVASRCTKREIEVTDAEISAAIVAALGGRTVGENELANHNSIEVINSVTVNDDGNICRTLEVSFETIEHRIARSNWFLTSRDTNGKCLYTSSTYRYGVLHPYIGPLSEQHNKSFIDGDASVVKRNDYNIYTESNHYGDYVFSFEAQDVFRIIRNYGKNYYVLVELISSDDTIYPPTPGRAPATVHTYRQSFYTGEPVRAWYGAVNYVNQVGDKTLAAKVTIKDEKRSTYPYHHRFQPTEDVLETIIKESVSFNPRTISDLPSCQA